MNSNLLTLSVWEHQSLINWGVERINKLIRVKEIRRNSSNPRRVTFDGLSWHIEVPVKKKQGKSGKNYSIV